MSQMCPDQKVFPLHSSSVLTRVCHTSVHNLLMSCKRHCLQHTFLPPQACKTCDPLLLSANLCYRHIDLYSLPLASGHSLNSSDSTPTSCHASKHWLAIKTKAKLRGVCGPKSVDTGPLRAGPRMAWWARHPTGYLSLGDHSSHIWDPHLLRGRTCGFAYS